MDTQLVKYTNDIWNDSVKRELGVRIVFLSFVFSFKATTNNTLVRWEDLDIQSTLQKKY